LIFEDAQRFIERVDDEIGDAIADGLLLRGGSAVAARVAAPAMLAATTSARPAPSSSPA
jgi:hypothetical protein